MTVQCIHCGNQVIGKRRITCSYRCSRTTSKETRGKISASRKRYLTDNPDKHPWKKSQPKSAPCEKVKAFLRSKNIDFIEEFKPLENRFFSIDIAFPHIKIGIEINGNQHYKNDGALGEYYQARNNEIELAGWKLIQVHYSQCYSIEKIEKFLDFDIPYDSDGIMQAYLEMRDEKIKQKQKQQQTMPRGKKARIKADERWNLCKNKIFDHNIVFSKYGWVQQVADLIGICSPKVKAWMLRYHPDFYSTCYKRKQADLG